MDVRAIAIVAPEAVFVARVPVFQGSRAANDSKRHHKKLGESGHICYEIHGLSGPVLELVESDSELTRAWTDSAEPLSHGATVSGPLITPGHSFQLPNYSRKY